MDTDKVCTVDPGYSGRDPLPAVRVRLRRRRRIRTTAAVVALCSVVGTAMFAVATAQHGDPPALLAGPVAPELRGLPSYLRPVDPTEAVLRMARPQIVPIGARTAYEGVGPVARVVVVFDFEAPLGLPGTPREARAPTGAQVLATDDAVTSTGYLSAWAPDGRSWFMAVTADESEVRSSTLDLLVETNLG
ncbi:hypothetical protein [Micromonospora sp. LOL_024]|uniref:hypothetical protein n=1 Tax=Micromonospora sp. LOL_024 TaxID=3345412 RepID=UPI003A86C89E